MTLNEYQKLAAQSMLPKCCNINYLGFGLVGEAIELISAIQNQDDENIILESGDCYWYISQISAFWLVKLKKLHSIEFYPKCYLESFSTDTLIIQLIKKIGVFCEGIKRIIRGDGKLDDEIILNLSLILHYLIAIDTNLGYSIDDILRMNIEKLNKRMANGSIAGKGDKR